MGSPGQVRRLFGRGRTIQRGLAGPSASHQAALDALRFLVSQTPRKTTPVPLRPKSHGHAHGRRTVRRGRGQRARKQETARTHGNVSTRAGMWRRSSVAVRKECGRKQDGGGAQLRTAPGRATERLTGHQFTSQQTFGAVAFQDGVQFANGGWFTSFQVQVLQGSTWVNVPNQTATPTYAARRWARSAPRGGSRPEKPRTGRSTLRSRGAPSLTEHPRPRTIGGSWPSGGVCSSRPMECRYQVGAYCVRGMHAPRTGIESVWMDGRLISRSAPGGNPTGHVFALPDGKSARMCFETNTSQWSLEVAGKVVAPSSMAGRSAVDRKAVEPSSKVQQSAIRRVARYTLLAFILPTLAEMVAAVRGGHPAWLLGLLVLIFPIVIALGKIEERPDITPDKKRKLSLLVVAATLGYLPLLPLRSIDMAAIRRLTRRDSVTNCELDPGKVYLRTAGGFFDVAALDAPARCVNASVNGSVAVGSGGSLYYADETGIHRAARSGYTFNGREWQQVNDVSSEAIPLPPCERRLGAGLSFLVAAPGDAGFVYECPQVLSEVRATWLAKPVRGRFVALGPRRRLLVSVSGKAGVAGEEIELLDELGGEHEIVGMPAVEGGMKVTGRAVEDEFLVAVTSRSGKTLFRVDEGATATRVGAYPSSSSSAGEALGVDGALYVMSPELRRLSVNGDAPEPLLEGPLRQERADDSGPPKEDPRKYRAHAWLVVSQ